MTTETEAGKGSSGLPNEASTEKLVFGPREATIEFARLPLDASEGKIEDLLSKLDPRAQVRFFDTLAYDPVRSFRSLVGGQKGREKIRRNAGIGSRLIVELQEKRVTPLAKMTEETLKLLPKPLAVAEILADLKNPDGTSFRLDRRDPNIAIIIELLSRVDGIRQLALFKGVYASSQTYTRSQTTYEGHGTGRYSSEGTGKYHHLIATPVAGEIVEFKVTNEATSDKLDMSPESHLKAIEKALGEGLAPRIKQALAVAMQMFENSKFREEDKVLAAEKLRLITELCQQAEDILDKMPRVLEMLTKKVADPEFSTGREEEEREFIELRVKFDKIFGQARLVKDDKGERVVECYQLDNHDDSTLLRLYKLYENATYPFWFTDRLSRMKLAPTSYGYSPYGLKSLRSIELFLMQHVLEN